MSEKDGNVAVAQVILVLRTQPELSILENGTNVQVVQNGVPEVHCFQDPVPRKMLQYLARKYGVRIEWFFHPEMCKGGTGTQH